MYVEFILDLCKIYLIIKRWEVEVLEIFMTETIRRGKQKFQKTKIPNPKHIRSRKNKIKEKKYQIKAI